MRVCCLLFLTVSALAQKGTIGEAIESYRQAKMKGCSDESCQRAVSEVIQHLIAAERYLPAPLSVDLAEGRRIALRLMPERQIGASPGSGGGTSLASLASMSELISAALESGAFQRNTAGTISTIRINPAGVVRLVSGDCPKDAEKKFPGCIDEDRSRWRGLSFMASFDSARSDLAVPGNVSNPAALGSAVFLKGRRNLASAGVRYDLYKPAEKARKNKRHGPDAGSIAAPTKQEIWKEAALGLKNAATAYNNAYAARFLDVMKDGLRTFNLEEQPKEKLSKEKLGKIQEKLENDFREQLKQGVLKVPVAELIDFQDARRKFVKAQIELELDTLDRRLFSLEFQHQRPKDEPEYGNLTFVWGDTAGKHITEERGTNREIPNWSFTVNAGANFFYNKQKVQKDRMLRDVHFSFQADRRLWNWKVLNKPTFTLAGYYQRLTDDAVLEFNSDAIVPDTGIALPKPANVILKDTKGNVGIVQAKLTIPLHDAGVSFPMAVTWSNRTELLRLPGNDVRGHFGLLFDIDKLLSTFKAEAKVK